MPLSTAYLAARAERDRASHRHGLALDAAMIALRALIEADERNRPLSNMIRLTAAYDAAMVRLGTEEAASNAACAAFDAALEAECNRTEFSGCMA